MENLRLITPCEEYLNSYIEAYNEDVNFRAGMDECLCPPETVIETACQYRNGIDLPPERVPSSMLWLVTDNEFIGCTDIRHYLTDRLLLSDGHIGYEVRFSKWNKGYGTKLLALSLQYAKENFHFDKVLVTCDEDNFASARVIEKNGGIWENTLETIDDDGRKHMTKRYWINFLSQIVEK